MCSSDPAKSVETPENVGLIVAPPFTHLASVAEALKGSKVELSAQNCADHEKGAYTGEVAVNMLTSVGCQWTILGHSERRQYYGETDEKLIEKTKLALAAGLGVILCVGENLEQREAGKHFDVVTEQIKNVLYNFTAEDMAKITILYLNKGKWNGKQLVPEDWIERMTTMQFEKSMDASNPDWEDWNRL